MYQKENPLEYFIAEEDSNDILEQIEKVKYYYKWFILGIIVALIGAYIYLDFIPNQYNVTATILIDEESNGGIPSELKAFEELGLMGDNKKNVENEIGVLKSRSLMRKVVKELESNVTFHIEDRFQTLEIYKDDAPFKITFLSKDSILYNTDTVFRIQVHTDNTFVLSNLDNDVATKHAFGTNIAMSFGDIIVTPKARINQADTSIEYLIIITSLKSVAQNIEANVSVNVLIKNSSLVELKLRGQLKHKSQDILNELIRQYNIDAIEYKSKIGNNTNKFINERLDVIEKELTRVDIEVEQFKSSNHLTDISTEVGLAIQNNSDIENKIIDLNTQLKLIDYMSVYMSENSDQLIPANLGLLDTDVNINSTRYNEVLLERMRIAKSSGKKNPIIINLDVQLNRYRNNIDQSLVNLKSSIQITLDEALQQEKNLSGRISSVPRQEREYRNIQRQQQIIETLYLFLLEKREENAISLAATTPNSKLIDAADGSATLVGPKRMNIYLRAILIGILIPFLGVQLMLLLDNKLHTYKDLEKVVKAPYLGDIPESDDIENWVLKNGDRGSVAESFRMLRTNMNYMLEDDNETKVVFVTSTILGEGKTFVSVNMASVLALTNKKVLLISADIRKSNVAKFLNLKIKKIGLSMFLSNPKIQANEIVESILGIDFDVIQSGRTPPNPSELLLNGRFDEVLEYGREHYDYIVVDTSPINMVTDTLQLAQSADLFIYIVRANFIDKRLLEIPKKLYENKRLPNMAMVINGSESKKGYGYGYGYGYSRKKEKKPWFRR